MTRTEPDGRITVLADASEGKPLNAPNDVVVSADGAVWFTDPGYGILSDYEGDRAEPELPTRVYRIDPGSGAVETAIESLERPNGLCFSPDEQLLYVVDSGSRPSTIHVFAVRQGRPVDGRVFADMSPGGSDGIRCDVDGNLWVASNAGRAVGYSGATVWTPEGQLIGRIRIPEVCGNLCFGGPKRNRLFMAASRSIYAVYVNTQGAGMA